MEKWIKTYPKIFSKEECAGLIEWFEVLDKSNQLKQTKQEGHREFDDVNLNNFREQSLKVQLDVYKRLIEIKLTDDEIKLRHDIKKIKRM